MSSGSGRAKGGSGGVMGSAARRCPGIWALLCLALAVMLGACVHARPPAVRYDAGVLDAQGASNLEAFARLVGWVRFFHPSDQAAATRWENFVVESVPAVEAAGSKQELKRVLASLFRNIAPNVSILELGEEPPTHAAAEASRDGGTLQWFRHGYGLSYPGLYHGERVSKPAYPGATLLDPDSPVDVVLGPDLHASVPLAVHTQGGRSLPLMPAGRPVGSFRMRHAEAFDDADRSTRLATVILAWTVLEHWYPFWDAVDVDHGAVLRDALKRAAAAESALEYQVAIDRVLASANDGHAFDLFRAWPEARAPVVLGFVEEKIVVLAAASATGLRRGDIVLEVDGTDADTVLSELSATISAANPNARHPRAVGWLLKGDPGRVFELDVLDPTGRARKVQLVLHKPRRREWRGLRGPKRPPAPVAEIEPGIFYADLTRLGTLAARRAIRRLTRAKGIIFDLRGYPQDGDLTVIQHLIDAPVESSQFWVPVGPKADGTLDRLRGPSWTVDPKPPRLAAKVAFLVNHRALSYAETYLSFVEQYSLGELVGSASSGTNGNVDVAWLPGPHKIAFTGMEVRRHDGSRYYPDGIQPTVEVHPTIKGIIENRDEVLERAVEVIRAQIKAQQAPDRR